MLWQCYSKQCEVILYFAHCFFNMVLMFLSKLFLYIFELIFLLYFLFLRENMILKFLMKCVVFSFLDFEFPSCVSSDCWTNFNPLKTSIQYTQAGVYGKCMLRQNELVFNGFQESKKKKNFQGTIIIFQIWQIWRVRVLWRIFKVPWNLSIMSLWGPWKP